MSSWFSRRLSWVRRLRDRVRTGQSGQSLILFAVALATLVAGTGLVIDTGYAYQERRLAQNAADSAALAAAQVLAQNRNQNVSCATVNADLTSYVTANLPGATFTGSYIEPDKSVWDSVTNTSCTIPAIQTGQNPTVVGVSLSVAHTHNTFFMRLLNFKTVTVSGQATSMYTGAWQVPENKVLPIILDAQQWSDATGESIPSVVSPDPPGTTGCPLGSASGKPFGFWNGPDGIGTAAQLSFSIGITNPLDCGYEGSPKVAGFQWGPLNITSSNSNDTIKCLLQTSCTTSTFPNLFLSIGDNVEISGGIRDVNFFNNSYLGSFAGKDVIVPLVSDSAIVANGGCASGCTVPVVALAWIHIFSSYSNGNNSYFVAAWDDPNDSCCPPIPGNTGTQDPPTYQLVSWSLVK